MQVSFTYSSGAEEKPDLSLPLDSKLESRLHQLVLDKETKMESAYPIRFAKEGEVISKPNTLLPQEARMPTVPELDALAKALRISEVSLPDKNQKKLEVFYSTGHNNWMGHQYDGLFVAPGQTHPQPVILVAPDIDPLRQVRVGVHEIAHLRQDTNWGSTSAVPRNVAEKLGWAPRSNLRTLDWGLKATNGNYYCFSGVAGEGEWNQCDTQRPMFSNDDMRQLALIKPATNYFDNPTEMDAETVTMFRMGAADRAALFKLHNGLYELAKEEDQRDIDRKYPPINLWSAIAYWAGIAGPASSGSRTGSLPRIQPQPAPP